MASWTAYENRNSHLTLVYRDLTRGLHYQCGEVRRDTPSSMLVEWVVRQEALRPGDLIKLPNGAVLQVSLSFAYA